MYVIFADRNSDWPPVQFVTDVKEAAIARFKEGKKYNRE